MRRLLHMVHVHGLYWGVKLRWSEMRRGVRPCWGGPFDGEWRFSTVVSLLNYVQVYPATNNQEPIYSVSMGVRQRNSIGLYVYGANDHYEWAQLTPEWSDTELCD